MKAAFAVWDERIAPVFDVARHLHVVEIDKGRIVAESREELDDAPSRKAQRLDRMDVRVLVCGAISRELQTMVAARGIRVVPFVAGSLREVLEAWLRGRLGKDAFAMPGCCGRGRHRHHHEAGGSEQEVRAMAGEDRDSIAGSERGLGRGVQRLGRRGGTLAAGPGGLCVCPRCGRQGPHERGISCMQKQCPSCGVAMIRQ
jgi:predicted Fe-Mo cluster-binding NifX family protein